jgi:hypothetical protein
MEEDMRSSAWLIALALALPLVAEARAPLVLPLDGPGVAVPVRAPGRHAGATVWLPLAFERVAEEPAYGCAAAEHRRSSYTRSDSRRRHWHVGPPCVESGVRYRGVE